MIKDVRELDQLVSLMRPTRTGDGMGGATVQFVKIASMWAKVRPMSGRERFAAAQLQADASYVITIRTRADIEESDIIRDSKGATYDIQFIGREHRSQFMDVQCSLSKRQ